MKKILFLFLYLILICATCEDKNSTPTTSRGQLSLINVGSAANDGTGESLRSAMIKTNSAITQLNRIGILDITSTGAELSILHGVTANKDELNILDGASITTPELNYLSGVTSAIQSQFTTLASTALKWDGGATGLTAATGRTSLGATTAGSALFTLSNPSIISFLRINADNTASALSATDFKTSLSLENVTNESKATMFTSPPFTGVPLAPTAAAGTNTTQIATTAFTTTADNLKLNSADFADSLNTHTKDFNVRDFGAKGDGSTQDIVAIRAAVAAAQAYGSQNATVYFPNGRYRINDTIVLTGDANNYVPSIRGEGFASVIYNDGTTPTLCIRDATKFYIEKIHLKGNGVAEGAGATNGHGLLLDHVWYATFRDLVIRNNGGHGVYAINGNWETSWFSNSIEDNAVDGMNFVSINTQEHGGINGNALNVYGGNIYGNADDGGEFAGADNVNFYGVTVESNRGSGIQVGSSLTTDDTQGCSILGCHFEQNDSSQIKIISNLTESAIVSGVTIEGNTLWSNQTDGDDALITQETFGGTYYTSLRNSRIGKNTYTIAGVKVVYYVKIPYAREDVIVDMGSAFYDKSLISVTTGALDYIGQRMPIPRSIIPTTAGGVAANMLYPVVYTNLGADVDSITANPQIADGFTGQIIRIINNSDLYKLSLHDGYGLVLRGGVRYEPEVRGDYIDFIYYAADWHEINRSTINEYLIGKADRNAPIFYNGILTDALKVGDAGSPLTAVVDSVTFDDPVSPTLFRLYSGSTQLIPDVPAGAISILFRTAAGDTSNYSIPDQIGQFYINTTNGDSYISWKTTAGGWRLITYEP